MLFLKKLFAANLERYFFEPLTVTILRILCGQKCPINGNRNITENIKKTAFFKHFWVRINLLQRILGDFCILFLKQLLHMKIYPFLRVLAVY